MKYFLRGFTLLSALVWSNHAGAAEAAPALDKERFTLFNPTPQSLMRELSTDRPDKTECPFTVDAGHLQIEWDWAVYAKDRDKANGSDTRASAWAIGPVNLKLGLNNWSDLQLMLEPLLRVRSEDRTTTPATIDHASGFGDVTVRYKMNFWGNDGGSSALGLMPFVKLPTNQHGLGNNAVEGGVILPFNRGLPGGWEMGTQIELDAIKNESGKGYHAEYVTSLTVGHDLVGTLGGYAEIFSQHSAERLARWVGTLDFGLTYGLRRDIQLDAGLNIGISPAAPDIEFFTGMSLRF